MKVTDDLIEGNDLSLKEKKMLILVSSSSSLEDLLHVICVYTKMQSLSLDKGILSMKGNEGTYVHDSSSYLDYHLYYDISSKKATLVIIGDDNAKFGEFTNNLLKIKGMEEVQNGI